MRRGSGALWRGSQDAPRLNAARVSGRSLSSGGPHIKTNGYNAHHAPPPHHGRLGALHGAATASERPPPRQNGCCCVGLTATASERPPPPQNGHHRLRTATTASERPPPPPRQHPRRSSEPPGPGLSFNFTIIGRSRCCIVSMPRVRQGHRSKDKRCNSCSVVHVSAIRMKNASSARHQDGADLSRKFFRQKLRKGRPISYANFSVIRRALGHFRKKTHGVASSPPVPARVRIERSTNHISCIFDIFLFKPPKLKMSISK